MSIPDFLFALVLRIKTLAGEIRSVLFSGITIRLSEIPLIDLPDITLSLWGILGGVSLIVIIIYRILR